MKNKITIVSSEFPPEPGGIGNHAHNLAQNFFNEGFDVNVVSDFRLKNNEFERSFDEKLPYKVIRIPFRKLRIIMYFERIVKVFKTINNCDVVFASGKFSLWVVSAATLFFNKKFIAIVHGTEINLPNEILKKVTVFSLKRFDNIIAVSNYTKSLITSINIKNVEVIFNGFKITSSRSVGEIKTKGSPSLITVGSVTERKGQINVILALPELLKDFPKIHYHIVGTPVEKEKYELLAKELNVLDYITFHGVVNEKKKNELLKGSDIFVMLSNKTSSGDVEGFGISILEANHFSIPSIGALNCGIEDAIWNKNSGVLIDNDNIIAFKKAIHNILNDYDNFSKKSKLWSEKFTWEIIIKQYVKMVNS